MKNETLVGKLRCSSATGTYVIETGPGKFFLVGFPLEHQAISTPLNIPIALSVVRDVPDRYDYMVVRDSPWFTPLPGPVADTIRDKVHFAIWKKIDPDMSTEGEAKELARAELRARQVQDFYRLHAPQWDVVCRGFTIRTTAPTAFPYYLKEEIKQWKLDNPKILGDFEPNYHQAWGDTHPTRCGEANKGGAWGVTFLGSSCTRKSTIHELGHQLGLLHANMIGSTGSVVEYSDPTSTMGLRHTGLNSPQLLFLGLEDEREILKVTESRQVLLAPIELDKQALREGEYQHVLVQPGGRGKIYYLSTRKVLGHPFAQRKGLEGAVHIHTLEKDASTVLLKEPFMPGSRYRANKRLVIKNLEHSHETCKVNVLIGGKDTSNTLSIPEHFPLKIPSAELTEDHRGSWYDPRQNGQGVDVHVRGGRLAVTWYTFNEKDDARRFYLGSCEVTDDIESFDLYTSDKGSFDDPLKASVYKVGRGQIYFLGKDHGVFNYDTEEHGRGSIHLTRLTASKDVMSGVWFQPSRQGEGFTFQFLDNGKVAGFWYTYGPRRNRDLRVPQYQRWFTCLGEQSLTSPKEFSLTVYESVGGRFRQFDEAITDKVGSIELSVLGENKIRVDWGLYANLGSDNTSGSFELNRLL